MPSTTVVGPAGQLMSRPTKGKRDQPAGRIQETYGITKDQAEVQVKAFEEANKDFESKTSA
jgi:uncharacterized protein YjbJ (UPF0337 family)